MNRRRLLNLLSAACVTPLAALLPRKADAAIQPPPYDPEYPWVLDRDTQTAWCFANKGYYCIEMQWELEEGPGGLMFDSNDFHSARVWKRVPEYRRKPGRMYELLSR